MSNIFCFDENKAFYLIFSRFQERNMFPKKMKEDFLTNFTFGKMKNIISEIYMSLYLVRFYTPFIP